MSSTGTVPVPTFEVSELFYSVQGEGARAGEPSLFLRLKGCTAKYACRQVGVLCDTEFESGRTMTIDQIVDFVKRTEGVLPRWVVVTGGEPFDQLTLSHLRELRECFARVAVETSGIHRVPIEMRKCIDFLTVSPKVAEHVLAKNFEWAVDKGDNSTVWPVEELRYVRHAGQVLPSPSLRASHYYLSPHSNGQTISVENLRHVIELVKHGSQDVTSILWRVSVQQHKLWGVL